MVKETSRAVLLVCAALLLCAVPAVASSNSQGAPLYAGDPPYVVGSGWAYFATSVGTPGPFGGWGGTYIPPNNEPFTFVLAGPGVLKVTDAFLAGDYLRVWDNGGLLGDTPAVPVDPSLWIGDPDSAFADPRWSHGQFDLGAGPHSLQFQNLLFAGGTAPPGYSPAGHYFRVDPAVPGPATPIPEPATLVLLLIGALPAAGLLRKGARQRLTAG